MIEYINCLGLRDNGVTGIIYKGKRREEGMGGEVGDGGQKGKNGGGVAFGRAGSSRVVQDRTRQSLSDPKPLYVRERISESDTILVFSGMLAPRQ